MNDVCVIGWMFVCILIFKKKKACMYVLYFVTSTLESNSVFSIWLVGDDVKEKKPDPSIYLTASNVI